MVEITHRQASQEVGCVVRQGEALNCDFQGPVLYSSPTPSFQSWEAGLEAAGSGPQALAGEPDNSLQQSAVCLSYLLFVSPLKLLEKRPRSEYSTAEQRDRQTSIRSLRFRFHSLSLPPNLTPQDEMPRTVYAPSSTPSSPWLTLCSPRLTLCSHGSYYVAHGSYAQPIAHTM